MKHKHHRIKEQDENITESDIEALERFLVATTSSGGIMANKLDLRKYFVIAALTIFTCSHAILIEWSKRAGKYEYSLTTANFLAEALKCALSLVALFKIWRSDGITQDNKLSISFDEVSIYSFSASLYFIKSILQYSIFAYVDARTYNQVLKNLNIFSTGVLCYLVLKRKLSVVQWTAFILLYPGCMIAQQDTLSDRPPQIPLQGWVIAIVITLLSGFTGVYTEAIIKKLPSKNINVQIFWLSIFGLIFNLVAIFIKDFDDVISKGFFHGYSFITVCIILNHALSGIAILMVMKYADNIVKVYSTSVAMLLTIIVSKFLFGFHLSLPFFMGFIVVSICVWLHAENPSN